MFDLDHYDPPSYGGTPMQEAHAEMIQIFGMEQPEKQWILTNYDVWEKNPYYHGPEQQHPECCYSAEQWEWSQEMDKANKRVAELKARELELFPQEVDEKIPF